MNEHEKRLRTLLSELASTGAAGRGGAVAMRNALDRLLADHRPEVDRLTQERDGFQRARNEEERDKWFWKKEAEKARAALSSARATALEEAAGAAVSMACEVCGKESRWNPNGGEGRDGDWEHVHPKDQQRAHKASPFGERGALERIRALASQPASVVQVAKVREVLAGRYAYYDGNTAMQHGARGALAEVATLLGVDLDATGGEADTRQTCTCLGSCRGPEGLGPGWTCALGK